MAATIIGTGLTIEGHILTSDDVRVHGRVRGRIESKAEVEIATGGMVESEVIGTTVKIAGSLTANVSAQERVDLLAGGRLNGDVRSPRLTIADGAVFRGQVDMSSNDPDVDDESENA